MRSDTATNSASLAQPSEQASDLRFPTEKAAREGSPAWRLLALASSCRGPRRSRRWREPGPKCGGRGRRRRAGAWRGLFGAGHPPTKDGCDESNTHTVVAGDTLYKIAIKYMGAGTGTNIDKIKKANNLTSNSLSAGTVLKIPSN